ncbi:hypothetical protein AMS68_002575 [Peltaster fructicola]|uniref:Uncharacterized protein n=1 Tax=Peltaster fructicola TaxID=286661 RepID=A0A6H0XQZ0_9PEZI|nr:hypothetical protein AMS68_002575 [Peltaster fructicola]
MPPKETPSMSTATTSSPTSPTSERSYFSARPLNFSRPRPVDFSPGNRVHHDKSDSCGTPSTIPSFDFFEEPDHKQSAAVAVAPTVVLGNTEKEVVPDVVDFPWDEHLKDMRPNKDYRSSGEGRREPRRLYQPGGTTQSHAVELPLSSPPFELQRSKSASAPEVVPQRKTPATTAQPPPRTVAHKATPSLEGVPEEDWDGEDVRSHHTVSENGDVAELGDSGSSLWSSSSYGSEELTTKEIKKLRKKGINPALYAEMKAARRGRGRFSVNILSGNAYLS